MTDKKRLCVIIAGTVGLILMAAVLMFLWDGEADNNAEAETASVKNIEYEQNYSRGYVDVEVTSEGTIITNRREGYRITLPESVSAVISYSELGVEINEENCEYRIYMENFADKNQLDSYLSYSNRFLENTKDHKESYVETDNSGKYPMQITCWSRETLGSIEDDMNNYVCADAVIGDFQVCTVFARSSESDGLEEKVKAMAKSAEPVSEDYEDKYIRDYWAAETTKVYEEYFGEKSDLTWGVFKWGIDDDWKYLSNLEDRLNYSFDILLYYSHFESEDSLERIKRVLTSAHEEGRTVELTLQTKAQDEGNMVYEILNGEHDEYIRDYARLLNELEIPVLFRLCNEMNGDWCEYSAYHTSRDTEIFNEMYRYIFKIFIDEGAGAYTIWVWNPNEKSFPDYKWNHEYNYYPGDEYVDVIGITGYNTGTYYEGESWRSFDEIYEPIYQRAVDNYSKPLMITEFGCGNVGGSKADWIEDMFESIGNYEEIKAAVWWDGCDYDENGDVARSYLIEENEDVLDVFKKGFGVND